GVGLGERAAEHGEVLRKSERRPPVDQAMSRDDAVSGSHLVLHAEIATAMGDELVDFLEGARIEQQLDALGSRQLARGALPLQAVLPAAQLGALFEIFECPVGIHSYQR